MQEDGQIYIKRRPHEGKALPKAWSSTQKFVTLSSGEAELNAAVKASTELLGVLQLAKDWGEEHLVGEVLVDSAAALGTIRRKRCGKLRHVRVGDLWIQEQQDNGDLKFGKVDGENNPADVGTKHLHAEKSRRHMAFVGQRVADGIAEASPKVSK